MQYINIINKLLHTVLTLSIETNGLKENVKT